MLHLSEMKTIFPDTCFEEDTKAVGIINDATWEFTAIACQLECQGNNFTNKFPRHTHRLLSHMTFSHTIF
jgi:hypothetical protein